MKGITTDNIMLLRTCMACPEQYDAYYRAEKIGYLRLRHGYFRVDFPDCNGEVIYEATPEGDGIFLEHEREKYLSEAKQAIANAYNEKMGHQS